MIYKFIARVLFPPSFARIYRPEQKRAFPRETQLAGHTSRRALRESGDLTPLALGCEFSLSYALALLYIHVYVYIYTRVSLGHGHWEEKGKEDPICGSPNGAPLHTTGLYACATGTKKMCSENSLAFFAPCRGERGR